MTKGKIAQLVTLALALCGAISANIGMLKGLSPAVISNIAFVVVVLASALPSLRPSGDAAKKLGPGLLFLVVIACTPQQMRVADQVQAQAKTVCESKVLEQMAPLILTPAQQEPALRVARAACAAAESQCAEEALAFRREQLELQGKDAGAPPPAPPAPVPEADAAPPPAQQ